MTVGLRCFASGLTTPNAPGLAEPNAFVLATVAEGRPVSRSVLCKSADETGITFFTNYDSAKGDRAGGDTVRLGDLPLVPAGAAGPHPRPGEQGRPAGHRGLLVQTAARLTTGRVGVAPVAADRVARSAARPAGRGDRALRATSERVPVPPNWGGYLIAPELVEFWQGRENRVHNRIRVVGGRVERLQP